MDTVSDYQDHPRNQAIRKNQINISEELKIYSRPAASDAA